jgi:hypothetical protein
LKDELQRVKAKLRIQEAELLQNSETGKHSQSVTTKDSAHIKRQVKWLKQELRKRDDYILALN